MCGDAPAHVPFRAAIALAQAGPPLSPLFDDVAALRTVRSSLLVGTRGALAATPADLPAARASFSVFQAGYPSVRPLIAVRSAAAQQETSAALDTAAARFADPAATATQLAPLVAALLNRFNFGVGLVNAAVRASDLHRTAITDADRAALANLNDVALGLQRGLATFLADPAGAAAGAGTAPGSAFAKVQPALEAKAGFVNTAATLRSSLVAYATLVTSDPQPTIAAVQAAGKAALEQVAVARQALVGQFWTDPGLQAFLATLPAS